MDLAYQGIRYILSRKKSTILLWLWTLSVTFSAVTSSAQEPSEKRKWIGWGAADGSAVGPRSGPKFSESENLG